MQSVLVQLELINKDRIGLKERLFELIADLPQEDFDQLCNEIISLDKFYRKYDGVMITDRAELVRPFLAILPRVELVINLKKRHYRRAFFYRWLEEVHVSVLQTVCWELEDCYDQAIELLNTYVVTPVYPALAHTNACWQVDTCMTGNLSRIAEVVRTWGKRALHIEKKSSINF